MLTILVDYFSSYLYSKLTQLNNIFNDGWLVFYLVIHLVYLFPFEQAGEEQRTPLFACSSGGVKMLSFHSLDADDADNADKL